MKIHMIMIFRQKTLWLTTSLFLFVNIVFSNGIVNKDSTFYYVDYSKARSLDSIKIDMSTPLLDSCLIPFSQALNKDSISFSPKDAKPYRLHNDSIEAFITLSNNSYMISLKRRPFQSEKHKISIHKPWIMAINDKPFWGTDYTMPVNEIYSFEIQVNNQSVDFPENLYNDLFDPHSVYIYEEVNNNDIWCIELRIGDAAGAWSILYLFDKYEFVKRCVSGLSLHP